jgi:aminoglycoside phosphotransferase family enzyme/predicted kinase
MLQPAVYGDPAGGVRLIETHISQVFLAGDYAYKLRKPVRFDFVDFSTFSARKADCENELRLNRRLAPQLYLDVVPVVAGVEPGSVCFGGAGEIVENAVRMRRFDQRDVLLTMVQENRLDGAVIDALANEVADFHRAAPVATVSLGYGTASRVAETLCDCMAALLRLSEGSEPVRRVVARMHERGDILGAAFASRLRGGHVRECHGDLHLGNVVLIDGVPTPFDCLEFAPALRWSDTIYDAAFVFMDLLAHRRADLAWRFMNGYLERSGDYGGAVLMPFYAALRALIRARVALERARQRHMAVSAEADAFISLALELLERKPARLYLMHGVSGSGKSTQAAQIAETEGAIRVRSDAERTRRYAATPHGKYAECETDRVYRRMRAACQLGARAGFTMVADATFLARRRRKQFIELARRLGVPVTIVHCNAVPEELRRRVSVREREGRDASEAGLAVLEKQLREREPFDAEEAAYVVAGEGWPATPRGEAPK